MQLSVSRIIPTRVGTSHSDLKDDGTEQDHPHACGDKSLSLFNIARVSGIIPTRVGTREKGKSYETVFKDHPHACGDKGTIYYLPDSSVGSSPRVWGQDLYSIVTLYLLRIIPTRVGTRLRDDAMQQLAEDHPHACGDKYVSPCSSIHSPGSSPRVWGQDNLQIISKAKRGDHPHACGDKTKEIKENSGFAKSTA